MLNKNLTNKNRRDGRVGYGARLRFNLTSIPGHESGVGSSPTLVRVIFCHFGLFLEYIRVSGVIDIFLLYVGSREPRALSRRKTRLFRYARTATSPSLNPASLALPKFKTNTAFRFTSQEAIEPEY